MGTNHWVSCPPSPGTATKLVPAGGSRAQNTSAVLLGSKLQQTIIHAHLQFSFVKSQCIRYWNSIAQLVSVEGWCYWQRAFFFAIKHPYVLWRLVCNPFHGMKATEGKGEVFNYWTNPLSASSFSLTKYFLLPFCGSHEIRNGKAAGIN